MKTFEIFDNDLDKILPFAMAIEMIHTYSLIHDDLPAMDDDDMRRGKKTNHIVFGEDIAILAGDGLLNLAFEIMSKHTVENSESIEDYKRNTRAMMEIVNYSGIHGMIGGQVIDIKATDKNISEDRIIKMYKCKTAALFQGGIVAGAIIGGASEEEIEILRKYALNLGLSYQLQDDLLDEEEDREINKLTYLTFYDRHKTEMDINTYSSEAIKLLDSLNKDTKFLEKLTYKLIGRDV